MLKTIYFAHDFQESPEPRKLGLESGGYRVRLFPSPRELYPAIQDEPPSAVLLDVLLENQNGFEVVRELRQRFPRGSFPILLMSRIYRGRQFREEALRLGATDYLVAPLEDGELLERMNRAFADPGARGAA